MMFKATTLALLAATASALRPDSSIPVDSEAGRKLLSKARALDQQNDSSWMAGYSIKYMGCHSLIQVRDGEGGGNDQQSNLYTMNMVKFGLCPADDSCGSCGKGKAQYVVNMNEFINSYTEMKMNAKEQACENIRENCDCENANDDDACQNQCYTDAGMSTCINYDGQNDEYQAQNYLECAALDNGNGNGNGAAYYIGPVCSDGFDINLATFSDAGCTTKTKSGIYESLNYGASLPFEKESMVSNDCVACNQENYNNGNYEYQINEICTQSVQDAAKCESGLSGVKYYADESGCDYIHNILPKLSKATSMITGTKVSRSSSGGGGGTAVVFAVLFAITTAIMGAYSFFLYRKIHRAKVNLSATGTMA